MIRRYVVAPVLVAAAAALGGCGGGTSTAAPPTSGTTSTTKVSAPATTSSASTTASTVAVAGSACTDAQISVRPGSYGAATGNVAQVVLFVNVSATTCTLTGYPGAAGLNAAGAQVIQATRRLAGFLGGLQNGQQTPPTVTLAPGATASADVEGGDNPLNGATSCTTYPKLLVTPPNLTQSTAITVGPPGSGITGFPGCAGLSVNPIVPGDSGRLG